MNSRNEITPASFNFSAEWDRRKEAAAFFKRWADLARPNLAMFHVFTPPEQIFDPTSTVGEWTDFRRNWVSFQAGTFGGRLDPVAPYLGWAVIFDRQMLRGVDLSQVSRIGVSVEEIGDAIYFQLSPDIADVTDDFNRFLPQARAVEEAPPTRSNSD